MCPPRWRRPSFLLYPQRPHRQPLADRRPGSAAGRRGASSGAARPGASVASQEGRGGPGLRPLLFARAVDSRAASPQGPPGLQGGGCAWPLLGPGSGLAWPGRPPRRPGAGLRAGVVRVQAWGPCPPSGLFGARPWDWCARPVTGKGHRHIYVMVFMGRDTPAAPLGLEGCLLPAAREA